MIAKDKKQAIIKEYGRTEGDTGSPEVQIPYSKDQRADRALQGESEGSPLKKRTSQDGRSEKRTSCIP